MQKHFHRIVITLLLLCVVLVSGAVLNSRRVEAAPKRTYRADVANSLTAQTVLDQRAAEGWRLVATAGYTNQSGGPELLLVFEKE